MCPLLCTCPKTGLKVQGLVKDGLVGPAARYVVVDCLLCSAQHVVDLADDDSSTAESDPGAT